jgi:small-conductance mechanosensitive channel
MESWWTLLEPLITSEQAAGMFRAVVKIGVGFLVARLASRGTARLLASQTDAHKELLARRITFYLILGLFGASALTELGFDLGILLGAAGILTVALGFASQTSASNVISGLFLLGEKPFAVGDVIRVGSTVGEVLSVDLLSVKLRTFDNLFVRLPNETMIKSEITNLNRFPIRRYDLQVGVAYKEDMRAVRDVLTEVADQNPLCLEEPAPLILFQGYGESALNFQFSVWAKTENYLELRNAIPAEVKEAFDARGIEIPFPHRTLYPGSVADPFPVRVVEPDQDAPHPDLETNAPEPDGG